MDIKIENLCKSYQGKTVLNQFSAVFPEKQISCLMGKSGIGKTTLLSILMKLEKPDSGTITGLEHKKISAVFQENRLLENLDAVKNIEIATGCQKEKIIEVLKEMEIDPSAGQPVKEYSGGMKRRVAIARALLADFDVLIMDEPLQGLDKDTREKVVSVMKHYMKEKTVILVSHAPEDCKTFEAVRIDMVSLTGDIV